MNLVSCDCCGVILDKDKLKFPIDIHESDGSIDDHKAAWDGNNYVAKVPCPVCRGEILCT